MSTESTRDLIRRSFDVINEAARTGNFDLLDEVIAPDIVDHHTGVSTTPGAAGIKETMAGFTAAFPDFHFNVIDVIADGDRAAVRSTITVTHRGDFMGVPPSGKAVEVPVLDMFRVDHDHVVETWGEMDSIELLKQIDALPASMPGAG